MAPSTEQLRRDLEALRHENARLNGVEAELAAAMESLRGSEERLRLAVDAAQMGLWEWDMLTNRVSWDAKKHDVFGLAHGAFAGTKEAFFEMVHPDDRPMLAMAITSAVEHGAPYHNEFRIMAPAGHTRWIANLGQVYRDDEGRPLRMIGVVYDVTDRNGSVRISDMMARIARKQGARAPSLTGHGVNGGRTPMLYVTCASGQENLARRTDRARDRLVLIELQTPSIAVRRLVGSPEHEQLLTERPVLERHRSMSLPIGRAIGARRQVRRAWGILSRSRTTTRSTGGR